MDVTSFQSSWPGLTLHTTSVITQEETTYALVTNEQGQRLLAVQTATTRHPDNHFEFASLLAGKGEQTLWLGPLNARNAAWLRECLAFLNPTPQGLRTSVGLGDRLGLATPGHLQAIRATGKNLAPVPAQQSIREMARTGRTPQKVLDDAMWGVFAEGWQAGYGADADHLKTLEDIDRCLAAGYTFYTFDPGQYVDDTGVTLTPAGLHIRLEELPWEMLEDRPGDLFERYLVHPFHGETYHISFDEQTILQAAVKYGRAVAHVATLYRYLASRGEGKAWEVEISVDETAFPTTHA